MKNRTRFVGALLMITSFASCQRNYSCSCTYISNGKAVQVNTGDIKGNKNHALHECCDLRAAQLTATGYANVSCAVPD
jgi:hypothetical protein